MVSQALKRKNVDKAAIESMLRKELEEAKLVTALGLNLKVKRVPRATGLSKSEKLCPRCKKICSFHLKQIRAKGRPYYYWYAAHYQPKKGKPGIKWCYVGKLHPLSSPDAKGRCEKSEIESINSPKLLYLNDASGTSQRSVLRSPIRNNREENHEKR